MSARKYQKQFSPPTAPLSESIKRLHMRLIKKSSLAVLVFPLFFSPVSAQSILDQYIQEAFQNNLVLRQHNLALDKSLIAIKEARSLFLPTTWFETQYTLTQGGRSINIPIGDLLNPVYSTLNQLTASDKFPTISNVKEQFLPNNFYDMRIKTVLPLINPDISINRNIKKQEVQLRENEILTYKRELAKEIKTAYFNYLMSGKAVNILEEAMKLVQENLRVNQSLLSNGKGLPAYVTRAESELLSVESQLLNAKNTAQTTAAYFNFLLNRRLTEPVISEDYSIPELQLQSLLLEEGSFDKREELKSLSLATSVTGNVLKMNRSYSKPRLNAFIDFAAQDFDFNIARQSFFYLGGFQLNVPIYTGKRNLYRIEQTQADLQNLRLQTELTNQQLKLAMFNARNNARNAYNTYSAAVKREQSAVQYFRLMERGYREGASTFIEFLDARNQFTGAQLETNINKYKFLADMAEYERQIASYNIQ